jgi:hypothetical protein
MRRASTPTAPGFDPADARRLVHGFMRQVSHRLTKGGDPEADRRACFRLARRLVAQDPTLAARLHYTLAFDRLNIDPDDHEYIVANALALVVGEMYLIVRNLNSTGDIETARREIEKVVDAWSKLVAGIPGPIRRPPGS